MSNILKSLSAALLTVLAFASSALAGNAADQIDAASRINAANALLRAGKVDEAIEGYRQIQPADVNRDELNYNLAVAQFRKGDIESAKGWFTDAAAVGDSSIASRSRYNLGNCFYSEALRQSEQDKTAAIHSLREAISHYRGALQGDPNNVDARANIELAVELLRKLQEEQQQEQQQQEQQQQEQQQQEQQQQDQQSDQTDQSDQQQSDQTDQSDQQQQQSDQTDQSDPAKQSDQTKQSDPAKQSDQTKQSDPAKQSCAGEPQPSSEENGDAKQEEVPAGELSAAGEQDESGKPAGTVAMADPTALDGVMSKEEALKMLQAVRDRDMLRRLRQQQLERSRHVPVDRDW